MGSASGPSQIDTQGVQSGQIMARQAFMARSVCSCATSRPHSQQVSVWTAGVAAVIVVVEVAISALPGTAAHGCSSATGLAWARSWPG